MATDIATPIFCLATCRSKPVQGTLTGKPLDERAPELWKNQSSNCLPVALVPEPNESLPLTQVN